MHGDAGSNLFHQGLTKETDDPDAMAATMSKPCVLERPAGAKGRFREHSGGRFGTQSS